MRRAGDHRGAWILAAYAGGAGLLALASTPVYVLVEASSRPHVVRLAAALFVGVALTHATKAVRARLDRLTAGAPEAVLPPAPAPAPLLDPRLATLQQDVRSSLRSRREFERVLWPRLLALAVSLGADPLTKPPPRRAGRGPSVGALRDLVTALERRA